MRVRVRISFLAVETLVDYLMMELAAREVVEARRRVAVAEATLAHERRELKEAEMRLADAKLAAVRASPQRELAPDGRRRAQELSELTKMALPPIWSSFDLVNQLRALEVRSLTVESMPFDLFAALLHATAIARCETNESMDDIDESPDEGEADTRVPLVVGTWFAVSAPALDTLGRVVPDALEDVLLCLGQDPQGSLCGAISWWCAGTLNNAGGPLNISKAERVVRLDDTSFERIYSSHTTVLGVGEDGDVPLPAMFPVHAPLPVCLAASMREVIISRNQISARLRHGGALQVERDHVETLLAANRARLETCMDITRKRRALPQRELSQAEAAVQGLRKTYLKREWAPCCVKCGVRHEAIEFGTCRFWSTYLAEPEVQLQLSDSDNELQETSEDECNENQVMNENCMLDVGFRAI